MFRGDGHRKYLRPDQQIRIWSHLVQEAALQMVGKGIRSRIQNLPNLRVDHKEIISWVNDSHARNEYDELISKSMRQTVFPDSVGNVDGYILYSIARASNAKRALEIGTRLGYSTVHVGLGLAPSQNSFLTTIDLHDMNNKEERLYQKFGSDVSPLELVTEFKLKNKVEFIVGDSAQYLRNSKDSFDFIFIDGDHSEVGAYFDILYSIQRLRDGGIIILHDYNNPNDPTPGINKGLYGVYWAIERLKQNLPALRVVPVNSVHYDGIDNCATSLAVLSQS